jgi:tyrosine-protein phosphatase SIW14
MSISRSRISQITHSKLHRAVNMKLYKIAIAIIFLLAIVSCKTPNISSSPRPSSWAKKGALPSFHNLYQVDENLYRSEQPTRRGMLLLDSMGIKTIVNLRKTRDDIDEAKNTRLTLKRIPINAWRISYQNVVASMKAIRDSKRPALVHCLHGSDRTGCIVAAYRMTYCGWTKAEAIMEFRAGGFGYHEKTFPNILRLLNTMDVEQLKKDIAVKE